VREVRGAFPVAVASNDPHSHLLAGLRSTGLDDVENPKPSPDRYLRACELLGVAATRASALEDSPPGVAAARAAGLFVIGIPSVPAIELAADVVAESLGDPRVREALDLDETAES